MSFTDKLLGRNKGKASLAKMAQIPLVLMDSKSPPFDDWQDPEVNIPEDLKQMFNYYSWLYQLYMFFVVTSERFGNDLAVKIIEKVDESEQKILGTTSFNIYENINSIHLAIQQLIESPIIEDMDGELSEMPLEYGLAKRFLLSGDFSPIKFEEEDVGLNEVAILGLCLFHAKQSALTQFENVISNIEIENA